jgi:O-antigen/teichoic acid export membrane protein
MTTRMTFMFSTALFGNVLQPSYARLQDEPKRLERAYLKSTSLVMLTMVPVSLGLLVLANMIVPVLFGDKWLPMVPVWQIFSLYALTRPISANSSPLFLATGRPRQNLYATILLVVIMIPLVLLVIEPYGIVGVAFVVSFTYFIGMLFNVFQVNQMLPGTALKTIKMVLPFFLAGGIMVLVILLARDTIIRLAGGVNVLSLTLLIVIGALTYVSMIVVLQRTLVIEMLDIGTEALGIQKRLPASFQRRLAAAKNN